MNRCFVFVVAAIVAVAAFGAVTDASPYVNGCRSQEECEEARCCIFDWIPGDAKTEVSKMADFYSFK